MKKDGFIMTIMLSLILISAFVIAQGSEDDQMQVKIDAAYQCIEDKIGINCAVLTQGDQAFALLSLGDFEDCKEAFIALSLIHI